MYKRMFCALFALLLFWMACAALAEERRVFMAGETAPFGDDERLLTLYVCPLMGADSMLLTFEEHSMLVDMAKESQAEDVLAMLERAGLDAVEYAFNTHPHNDHVGSIPVIAGRIGIGTFMTAFPHDYTGSAIAQRKAIRALEAAGVPIRDVDDGDTIDFGDVEITVWRQTAFPGDNATSAMLFIRYGECTLLLTADVEGKGLANIAELHDVKADIAKAPHHGLTKMDASFFEELAPEYMFIPHGSVNTQAFQKQADEKNVAYQFCTWGPITMATNGEKWIVEQQIFKDKLDYAQRYFDKR